MLCVISVMAALAQSSEIFGSAIFWSMIQMCNSKHNLNNLSMTIDVGDMNVKAKKTVEMLGDGNKVKVSIRMRGRQMAHAALGVDVMNRFFDMLGGKAVMDKAPKTEGRNILMILAPAK